MGPPPQIKRDQHPKFGKELRALLASKSSEDRMLAGIIKDELTALTKAKSSGQRYKHEDTLADDLRDIGYLRLYNSGFSARVYFSVIDGVLWMIALDPNKRVKNLSDSMKVVLRNRLSELNIKTIQKQ